MKTVPLLALALTLLLPTNDAPSGDAKDMQGTWRVVLLQDGGETVPIGKDSRVVITADRLKLKDKNYPIDVAYRLDSSKDPKWLDLGVPPAQHKGIYELKGEALKICYNERPQGARADAFVSLRDSPNDVLLVLQREKR